jgi:gas vesicle protein
MPRQDTVDFMTAFAVGTVLGIGTALLLQPSRSPKDRVLRELKPYRKQMKRSFEQVRGGVKAGRGATSDLTSEVVEAGRELLDEFRSEVAEILENARDEIQGMAGSQRKDLARGLKRARRRMGM